MYATLKLSSYSSENLPVDLDQQVFYRINFATLKGVILVYLHVIHLGTSGFKIKIVEQVLVLF